MEGFAGTFDANDLVTVRGTQPADATTALLAFLLGLVHTPEAHRQLGSQGGRPQLCRFGADIGGLSG